jgi:hypothetical protein
LVPIDSLNCIARFGVQAIWAKGYTELLDLMDRHKKRGEEKLHIDCYGSGEDLDAVTPPPPPPLPYPSLYLHAPTPLTPNN